MVIVVTAQTRVEASSLATALADRLDWPCVDNFTQVDRRGAAHTEHGRENGGHGGAHLPRSLRDLAVEACERREPLILTAAPLSHEAYAELTDGLRHVRVVGLSTAPRDAGAAPHAEQDRSGYQMRSDAADSSGPFAHLSLDSAGDIDALVGHVRLAFGV